MYLSRFFSNSAKVPRGATGVLGKRIQSKLLTEEEKQKRRALPHNNIQPRIKIEDYQL